jgi:hypothetical protein
MFPASTNPLQDSIDKDHVHFNRADYMFVGQDMLQIRTCGHILSHNIVHFHYFGNRVCPHDVQDRHQAKSTPRTAFHQEREDDEDMASTYTTMLRGRGREDQQGIRFESPRWRPKLNSSPSRAPEVDPGKLVTQDAYRLRFL